MDNKYNLQKILNFIKGKTIINCNLFGKRFDGLKNQKCVQMMFLLTKLDKESQERTTVYMDSNSISFKLPNGDLSFNIKEAYDYKKLLANIKNCTTLEPYPSKERITICKNAYNEILEEIEKENIRVITREMNDGEDMVSIYSEEKEYRLLIDERTIMGSKIISEEELGNKYPLTYVAEY